MQFTFSSIRYRPVWASRKTSAGVEMTAREESATERRSGRTETDSPRTHTHDWPARTRLSPKADHWLRPSAGMRETFCTAIGWRVVRCASVRCPANFGRPLGARVHDTYMMHPRTRGIIPTPSSRTTTTSVSVSNAMSLLARSAAPLRQVAVRARAAPVRSMHGEYKVRFVVRACVGKWAIR